MEFEANEDASLLSEDEAELSEVPAAQAAFKKLRVQLREAQAKRDEYLTGWQRCKADSVNARKDLLADAERRANREKLSFIEELIPVLDSFDMATGSDAWAEVNDGFRTGMEHVRNQLLDVLSRHGVERYGKVGEPFDPRLHEAVQEMGDVAGDPHSIVKILRYGYRSGEYVIRPAQIIIKS